MSEHGFVKKGTLQARHAKWQEENQSTVIEPNDFIKVGKLCQNCKVTEAFWIEVDTVIDNTIIGYVNSDIQHNIGYVHGGRIAVQRTEIMDHIKNK